MITSSLLKISVWKEQFKQLKIVKHLNFLKLNNLKIKLNWNSKTVVFKLIVCCNFLKLSFSWFNSIYKVWKIKKHSHTHTGQALLKEVELRNTFNVDSRFVVDLIMENKMSELLATMQDEKLRSQCILENIIKVCTYMVGFFYQ